MKGESQNSEATCREQGKGEGKGWESQRKNQNDLMSYKLVQAAHPPASAFRAPPELTTASQVFARLALLALSRLGLLPVRLEARP